LAASWVSTTALAVDLRRRLEVAAAPAHDLHRPLAERGRPAGHQLRHHAIGDAAELAAIGVGEHQHEAGHHPEQRGLERGRRPLAEHHQHGSADEHHQRQLVGQRSPVMDRQPGNRVVAVACDHHRQRQRNPDHQRPEQSSAHGDHPWRAASAAAAPRTFIASIRRGSSAMILARSAAL
jgi:hypothetical protein